MVDCTTWSPLWQHVVLTLLFLCLLSELVKCTKTVEISVKNHFRYWVHFLLQEHHKQLIQVSTHVEGFGNVKMLQHHPAQGWGQGISNTKQSKFKMLWNHISENKVWNTKKKRNHILWTIGLPICILKCPSVFSSIEFKVTSAHFYVFLKYFEKLQFCFWLLFIWKYEVISSFVMWLDIKKKSKTGHQKTFPTSSHLIILS